jgi:hypothetical protein
VQALGMAIFLPMIMIGGVGIPLATLPNWAQKVAGFFPGRYAVEAIQPCFDQAAPLAKGAFALVALLVIGIAGCIAGARLFRWDANQQFRSAARGWVLLAIVSWIAVGITASMTGHLKPVKAATTNGVNVPHQPWESITDAQIDAIKFDGLPADDGTVLPVKPPGYTSPVPEEQNRIDDLRQAFNGWDKGHQGDDGQRVRNYLSLAAVADFAQDPEEGPIGRLVFDRLEADFGKDELIHILAWIYLDPNVGTVITDAPEVDVHGPVDPDVVRTRSQGYGLKLLGRLLGKLPDAVPPS